MNVMEARVFGTSTMTLWCYRCGEMRPIAEYEDTRGVVVHTRCKACRKEARREQRKKEVDA